MVKKTGWFSFFVYIISFISLINIILLWMDLTSISIIMLIIAQGAILIKSRSLEKEVKRSLIKVISVTIVGSILLYFIPFLFQHI